MEWTGIKQIVCHYLPLVIICPGRLTKNKERKKNHEQYNPEYNESIPSIRGLTIVINT